MNYAANITESFAGFFNARYRQASGFFSDAPNSPSLHNEDTKQLFASVGVTGKWGTIDIYGDNLLNRDDTTAKYKPIGALPYVFINYVEPDAEHRGRVVPGVHVRRGDVPAEETPERRRGGGAARAGEPGIVELEQLEGGRQLGRELRRVGRGPRAAVRVDPEHLEPEHPDEPDREQRQREHDLEQGEGALAAPPG
jgi:hypothetical protein